MSDLVQKKGVWMGKCKANTTKGKACKNHYKAVVKPVAAQPGKCKIHTKGVKRKRTASKTPKANKKPSPKKKPGPKKGSGRLGISLSASMPERKLAPKKRRIAPTLVTSVTKKKKLGPFLKRNVKGKRRKMRGTKGQRTLQKAINNIEQWATLLDTSTDKRLI